jgi:two-component system cell cycle sensor histidine kinase/response regulator CckA
MPSFSDLESIINTIADPIFVKDREHRWVLLNDAYCRFMGFERQQLIGKSDRDFFPKAEADVFWEKDEVVFDTGTDNINDEDFTDSAGVTHSITTKKSLYISPLGNKFIVGCIRDLTDLKRAQQELKLARDRLESVVSERTAELAATNEALRQQIVENEHTADELRQSQKMEAIGRLAGGVAHDFNNLLNVIIGYASIIEKRPDVDAQLRESAGQIATAAEKAAAFTRQLLAFSRKQVLQTALLNIDDILRAMSKMLPSLIGEEIELVLNTGAPSAYVRADMGQTEQVIMNLVVNARDAMHEGGRLTITTSNLDLRDSGEGNHGEERIPPGKYVTLTVSDTGEGMDAQTQAHIFEPFFTTKGTGKGTGLGLATVYAIIKQNDGHIRVHSQPGQGTTLAIYFPQIQHAAPLVSVDETAQELSRGSETILLVEDQQALRELLGTVLQNNGYTVLKADSGRAAIEIANSHSGPVDLLITDIIMPGMRGWEVAIRIMELRPEAKVLYMSGHTDTDLIHEGALSAGAVLLEKPFRPEVLLLKVQDILRAESRCKEERAGG